MKLEHRAILGKVLDIHTEVLVSVALSSSYTGEEWRDARGEAQHLLQEILEDDLVNMASLITNMCKRLGDANQEHAKSKDAAKFECLDSIPPLVIRKGYWQKAYIAAHHSDTQAFKLLIITAARGYHLDTLQEQCFGPSAKWKASHEVRNRIQAKTKPYVISFNKALKLSRDGFSDAVTNFTTFNNSSAAQALLEQQGVAKAVMNLMVSPWSQLQEAAQSLVGLAYDVDVREDCFRALLQRIPLESLDGILEFLDKFVHYAGKVPEACSLAKTLVRCFTDVISVLCGSPDGLLRTDEYLKPKDPKGPSSKLRRLWSSMNRALAVICSHSVGWSEYFRNEDMIIWMRDALIFGREMLAQRVIIEKGAKKHAEAVNSSTKGAALEQEMVKDLQETLSALLRWLRLTDEELLYQSFSLLEALFQAFQQCQSKPSEDTLNRIQRLIVNAKAEAGKEKMQSTRLDATRLRKLEAHLLSFSPPPRTPTPPLELSDDDDDDVEIVKTVPPPKPWPTKKSTKPDKQSRLTVPPPRQPIASSSKMVKKAAPSAISAKKAAKRDQMMLDDAMKASAPTYRRASKPATSSTPSVATGAPRKSIEPRSRSSSYPSTSDANDDSSDSEPEPQVKLADLAKKQKAPPVRKHVEQPRRQIKMLSSLPVKEDPAITRQKREAEMAQRLTRRMAPNLSGLYQALLSWDYDSTATKPPLKVPLSRIPDVFRDPEHYRKTLEPLAMLDCWAQLCQSKDENLDVNECQITARAYVDTWLDLETRINPPLKHDFYIGDTDIVLLRHPTTKKCILAKVEGAERAKRGQQHRQNQENQPNQQNQQNQQNVGGGWVVSMRCLVGNSDPGLSPGSKWQMTRVFR